MSKAFELVQKVGSEELKFERDQFVNNQSVTVCTAVIGIYLTQSVNMVRLAPDFLSAHKNMPEKLLALFFFLAWAIALIFAVTNIIVLLTFGTNKPLNTSAIEREVLSMALEERRRLKCSSEILSQKEIDDALEEKLQAIISLRVCEVTLIYKILNESKRRMLRDITIYFLIIFMSTTYYLVRATFVSPTR